MNVPVTQCVIMTSFTHTLQSQTQLGGVQLPLANQRASDGRLFCLNASEVPEKAVLPLKFPLHLGSLRLPVSVRAACSISHHSASHSDDM